LRRQLTDLAGEGLSHAVRVFAVELDEHDEAGVTLDQRGDLRTVAAGL
jgi:hypothetical protein